jgi:hypothetical protein
LLAIVASVIPGGAPRPLGRSASTIHITSPLGRTGTVATVRIVAQVDGQKPASVRFLRRWRAGGHGDRWSPYAVDWIDDNPFESREIVAEAVDAAGKSTRDTVKLPAFEITDQTDIASIVLEAAVYDRTGVRSRRSMPRPFSCARTASIRRSTRSRRRRFRAQPADGRQQSEHAAPDRRGAQNDRAIRAARSRRGDRVIVAPFNAHIGTITGPTDDVRTIGEAIQGDEGGGGTAFVDAIADWREAPRESRGTPRTRAHHRRVRRKQRARREGRHHCG